MAASSSNFQNVCQENPEELQHLLIPTASENVDLDKRTLIGQLLSSKTHNREVTKNIIARAWSATKNLQISDLGKNKFLFTFEDEKDCKEIYIGLLGTS